MANNIGAAALAVARRELGVKENPAGSNWGPRVSVYLKNIGLGPAPWCAAFGEWCLEQVGWERGNWNTAFCPSWQSAANQGLRGMRIITPFEKVMPGDIALYDWQDDRTPDHFGIIEQPVGLFEFDAIEGNTAVGNDSNGGQVMRRRRMRSQTSAIIRLPAVQVPLSTRLAAAGYGAKTVQVILRRLKDKTFGTKPNPGDSRMFKNLREQGIGADSARKIIKTLRKK